MEAPGLKRETQEKLLEIAKTLCEMDWCVGYELHEDQHDLLDRARTIAFELALAGELNDSPEPKKTVAYAVGIERGPNSYWMCYGQTPSLTECVAFSPPVKKDERAFVFQFNGDAQMIVLAWDDEAKEWIKTR